MADVSTAIIGLVGVVVGACVTGGVNLYLASRADRRRLRTVARLVIAELQDLEEATISGGTLPALHYREEYQRVLAEALPSNAWRAVESAYRDFPGSMIGDPAGLNALGRGVDALRRYV